MRIILSTILIFLVTITYSQVIDWDNFDTKLIDSLVIDEANTYRTAYSHTVLSTSPFLMEQISQRQTTILVTEDKCYHPPVEHIFNDIKDSLIRESEYKNPDKKNFRNALHFSEICLRSYRQDNKFTTYQELAQYLINLWKTSSMHNEILLYWGRGENTYNLSGVSVQIGDYYWGGKIYTGIYASMHICATYLY